MQMKKSFLLIIFFILLDQLSKYIVRSSGGFYICNKGVAFGINIPYFVIWSVALVLFFYLIYLISNSKFQISNEFSNSKFLNIGVVFILAGGISNIIDRLFFGCVIDFINLKFWPIFNLADTFIVLGVIIVILQSLIKNNNQ